MKKKWLGMVAVVVVLIVAVLLIVCIPKKKPTPSADTSDGSQTTTTTVAVGDIPDNTTEKTSATEHFLEPDESEADRILQEYRTSATTTAATTTTTTTAKTTVVPNKPTTEKTEAPQSFEEDKQTLENTAAAYLKEHNIDPRTAGETGEVCSHCGKKIWNPDKYGFFIPGMPADYANSGYCLGTCGISFG